MANKFVALLQQELPSGLPFVATLADKYFVLSYLWVLPLGRGPADDQHRPVRLRHALALAHQRRGAAAGGAAGTGSSLGPGDYADADDPDVDAISRTCGIVMSCL